MVIAKPNILKSDFSCLDCGLFSGCNNPKKGHNFVCEAFTERGEATNLFNTTKTSVIKPLNSGKLIKSGTFNINNATFEKLLPEDYDTFDMQDIISKVKEDFATGLPRDLRVDTSDLPLAKNFIDFSTNPFFTNQEENPPWAKQVQIIVNLMTEYCHNPRCSDIEYAKNMPVDATLDQIQEKVTFLNHGICPKCKATKITQWNDYGAGRYNELMGLGGQRGSKTQTVNRGTKYFLHQCLKLPRPHKIFGIEEATSIEMTFTATTFGKAKENLYDPLVFSLKSSPWFKAYHELLDSIGKGLGEELYAVLNHSIIYRANRYHIYPATPNPQNARGSTRILAEIDEISHLFTKTKDAVKLNPGELRNALRNSLFTLRMAHTNLISQGQFNIPTPTMMNITSPRTFNDTGMQIYRESQKAKSRIYGFHYSILEMNPNATKSEEMREELKLIERENPEAYKRDFLAIPPNASNAFINNAETLRGCIIDGHSNAIKTKDIEFEGVRKGVKLLGGTYSTLKNKRIDLTTPKVLCVDASKSMNSFSIVVAHNELVVEEDMKKQIKVFDIMAEIIPRDGRDISHPSVIDSIIYPIIEEFNVQVVFADRWNSLHFTQKIEEEFDIVAGQYSLKYNDFLQFKQDLFEANLGFPMAEGIKIKDLFTFSSENYPMCFNGKPVAHFLFQCLTVEDIMGKTVDKGTGFTDDIFRATVLANWCLNDPELSEILENANNKQVTPQAFVGAVGSLGGGTTLLGGGTVQTTSISGGLLQGKNGAVAAIGSNLPYGVNR